MIVYGSAEDFFQRQPHRKKNGRGDSIVGFRLIGGEQDGYGVFIIDIIEQIDRG